MNDEEIRAYLESKFALVMAMLRPPTDMTDAAAWDTYWQNQLSLPTVGMIHMFVNDGQLVDAMRENDLRTVLCVGNGISQEPKALAAAGFDVTALDLSPAASAIAEEATPPDDVLAGLIGGRSSAKGGIVRFVTGDLLDPAVCPGPYDVIIERKTLQLYPPDVERSAIRAVAARLGARGIFFSHSHRNGPPDQWRNPQADWVREQGWPLYRSGSVIQGRTGWFYSSSG